MTMVLFGVVTWYSVCEVSAVSILKNDENPQKVKKNFFDGAVQKTWVAG